ncbi:GNAT family N-acetyltransferase [Bacteriovoracaceae bacterium]|nr:GNAT family N-acetyltransferase [Bacteriovoracaceae bacterium]
MNTSGSDFQTDLQMNPTISNQLVSDLYRLDKTEMKYSWSAKDWLNHLKINQNCLIIHKTVLLNAFTLYQVSIHDEVLHLQKIVVARTARRQGIARKMLESLVEIARSTAKKSIFLEVEQTNFAAVQFYQNNGFVTLRIASKFYSDGSNAIIMERLVK